MDEPAPNATQSDLGELGSTELAEVSRAGLIIANLFGDARPRVTVIETLDCLERMREGARRRRRRQELKRLGRRRRKKIAR